jgi:sensor histidine kinase YesM
LVENAIKHGIGPKMEGGEVRVAAELVADRVVIVVEDTGIGYQSASRRRGTGIGLTNIRERLQHLYGEAGGLTLEEKSPAGTRATLTLPQAVGVHS